MIRGRSIDNPVQGIAQINCTDAKIPIQIHHVIIALEEVDRSESNG